MNEKIKKYLKSIQNISDILLQDGISDNGNYIGKYGELIVCELLGGFHHIKNKENAAQDIKLYDGSTAQVKTTRKKSSKVQITYSGLENVDKLVVLEIDGKTCGIICFAPFKQAIEEINKNTKIKPKDNHRHPDKTLLLQIHKNFGYNITKSQSVIDKFFGGV